MLTVDPIMSIPGALTELISRQEARVGFIVSDWQMTITVDEMGTGRLLWQVKVVARSTASTWHVSEYSDATELRRQGIASEFYERLIQQAEEAGIKHVTAHCSPDNAAFFIQMFGAVRAGDIPPEERVEIFGRVGLEDENLGWNLDSTLTIFIYSPQRRFVLPLGLTKGGLS